MKPQKNRTPLWLKAALSVTLLITLAWGTGLSQKASGQEQRGKGIPDKQTPTSKKLMEASLQIGTLPRNLL
jgi:hypothetical protein